MLIRDLERRVGTHNLPYALLIAGHVSYGLPDVTFSDRVGKLHDMRENPDGRLVMLTMLERRPAYDPQALAVLDEHRQQLEAPEAIRHPFKSGRARRAGAWRPAHLAGQGTT